MSQAIPEHNVGKYVGNNCLERVSTSFSGLSKEVQKCLLAIFREYQGIPCKVSYLSEAYMIQIRNVLDIYESGDVGLSIISELNTGVVSNYCTIENSINNLRYFVIQKLGVDPEGDKEVERIKIVGGYTKEKGVYKRYPRLKIKTVQDWGFPYYMAAKLYTYLLSAFPELLSSLDEFPSKDELKVRYVEYLMITQLGVNPDGDSACESKKVTGGLSEKIITDTAGNEFVIMCYQEQPDLKTLFTKKLGYDRRSYVQMYGILTRAFPQFLDLENGLVANHSSMMIERVRFFFTQEKDIDLRGAPDVERKKITGGMIEKSIHEDGEEKLRYTYYEPVTREMLRVLGFPASVYNNKEHYFKKAFPTLFSENDEFPSKEDLYIQKIRYLITTHMNINLLGDPALERKKIIGGIVERQVIDEGSREVTRVFEYVSTTIPKTLKACGIFDLGYYTAKRILATRQVLISAFPEFFDRSFSFPSEQQLWIEKTRYYMINTIGVDPYGDPEEEKIKVSGGNYKTPDGHYIRYKRVKLSQLRELGYMPANDRLPLLERMSSAFPEFDFAREDFNERVMGISRMTKEELIQVYREVITGYMDIPEETPMKGTEERYEVIRKLIPPNITMQVIKSYGLHDSTILKKLDFEYYTAIIEAFPEYCLKGVMYGKKGGRKNKSKSPNFFASALGKNCNDRMHHEIYNAILEDGEKGNSLLNTYILNNSGKFFGRKKLSPENIGGFFANLYEMITELEEMVYNYDLDVLIKGSVSWIIQTEKRKARMELWRGVDLYSDAIGSKEDPTLAEDYEYTLAKEEVLHIEEDSVEEENRADLYAYLAELEEEDPIKKGFNRVLSRLKNMPKKTMKETSQKDILHKLEQECGISVTEMLKLL